MEILVDAKIVEKKLLLELMEEADELLAIIVASIKTARKK